MNPAIEIGFHHGDVGVEAAKAFSSGLNLWSIGYHQEVQPFCAQIAARSSDA